MKKYNTSKNMARLIFLFALTLSANIGFSQEDNLNTEVDVNGRLNLVIKDASKIDSWPDTYESILEMPTITYTLIPNKLRTNYKPELIKPAKINIEEKLKKLYRGYLKAGYGTFNTPLVELRFMDGRSRNGAFNIYAKHYSSNGNTALGDSITDSFRNNEISLWGKKFVGKNALEGYFDWKNEEYHFFGFFPEFYPDAELEKIGRTTNNFGAGVQLQSYLRDSTKLNYIGNFDFNAFSDNYKSSLNELNFSTSVKKVVEANLLEASIRIEYDQYDFIQRDDQEEAGFDNVLFELVPQATAERGNFEATVGASFIFNSRRIDDSDPFAHFYPLLNVQYRLFNDMFVPYGGIRGELTQNSYRTFVDENPFVTTDPILRNTNNKLEVYGGVRGTLSANAGFNARISHRKVENFVFWVNDTLTSPGSMFIPEYGDISITEIMGELTVNAGEKLDLFLKGQYYIYGSGDLEMNIPWYQPSFELSMIGRYNLDNKIIAEVEFYAMDSRKAKSYAPIPLQEPTEAGYYIAELKGMADFNLSLEYRYTKRLSGFVKFNNLFGSKYMRYNNYRAQRVAAMLGATYSF